MARRVRTGLRPAREADGAGLRQRRATRGPLQARRNGGRDRRARRRRPSTQRTWRCSSGSGRTETSATERRCSSPHASSSSRWPRRGPTLLLFEDIHWADASLLDLLETLAARVRDVPVLFLALARPELLNERPGLGRRPSRLHGAPARPPHRRRRAQAREPAAHEVPGSGGPRPDRCRDRGGQSALHRGAGGRRWRRGRPPMRRSYRRAFAPSSPPASTGCPPTSEASSSTPPSSDVSSGAERSRASLRTRGSQACSDLSRSET